MIDSKDISVVVQGPILHQDERTKRVLESVRTHLPEAELILSTWKGSDVSGLECDVLLLNDDPGAINGNNNVNRQIVSTRNGLQKATRHYAMKLRTDTLLTGTGFLDAFDRYPERRDDFKVFEHKIVIPTLYTRNPLRVTPYSGVSYFFHPSDIFQFGLSVDLLLLWDIPLASTNSKSVPEQYIWLACLRKFYQDIDYFSLTLREQLKLTEILLINNFHVEKIESLEIILPPRLMANSPYTCYTYRELSKLRMKYIVNRSNSISLFALIFLYFGSLLSLLSHFKLNLGLRGFFDKLYMKSST
ncbi:MAG: WavE lipopolysaccharide synthesis family protein [Chloroherpetonaceae bacterium]